MPSDVTSAEDFVVREVEPSDGETLQRLFEDNPDGGEIQFAPQFEADPYEMYRNLIPADDVMGFLAEAPDGSAAGTGFVAFSDARVGGELRKRGYLAGLVVDSEYRGLGLAKRLAAERIRYAERTFGDDVAIAASIQRGNEASMAVADTWAASFPYEFVNHSVEVRDGNPDVDADVRRVGTDDLPRFVDGMNRFYDDAELFSPYDADQLADLLAVEIEGKQVHRCDAVVEDGEFVAGMHVVDNYKLMSTVVEDLPPALEDADELPPSIPDDREIRPSFVIPWFELGHEAAAEALVEYERATAGDANRLMFVFDPEGPLGDLDALEPDDGTIELNWALRGLEEPEEDSFVAPGLG